jgi:hemolysin activation/secretion protein
MNETKRQHHQRYGYVNMGPVDNGNKGQEDESGLLMEIMWILVVVVFTLLVMFRDGYTAQEEETVFEIKGYIVKGNTLLDYDRIIEGLKFYAGQNKTSKDVEEARKYLEKLYHNDGYPTVLVNIPPQDVLEGVVTLEVIESKIGEVRVTGNRYHTKEKILEILPVFRRGELLYVPEVQKEMNKANSASDLKIEPILMPGKELGTTDVELRATDYFPLHGSIELNNRSTHSTSDLRLNGVIHYDNLWQSSHSISLQYQMSPQETDEVKAFAASYVLPAPWNEDHILAAYGVISDSQTAFGEGFQVNGKGDIYGLQYAVPLPFYKIYSHSISFGVDYKHMRETQGTKDSPSGIKTPITYLPFNIQYNSNLPDSLGATRFQAGMSTCFRGFITREVQFEDKRYKARADYFITKLGVERDLALPKDASLFFKVDGQLSGQPLISNEQYTAGGMDSVRGYKESEEAGDNALHGTVELRAPDLLKMLKIPGPSKLTSYISSGSDQGTAYLTPYLFCDAALLTIIDPLPQQDRSAGIYGAGLGLRGSLTRYFQFETDYAVALRKTDQTDKNSRILHFLVKGQF